MPASCRPPQPVANAAGTAAAQNIAISHGVYSQQAKRPGLITPCCPAQLRTGALWPRTDGKAPPGEDRDQPMDKLKPFSSQHPISAPCHQAASVALPGTHRGWGQGSATRGPGPAVTRQVFALQSDNQSQQHLQGPVGSLGNWP